MPENPLKKGDVITLMLNVSTVIPLGTRPAISEKDHLVVFVAYNGNQNGNFGYHYQQYAQYDALCSSYFVLKLKGDRLEAGGDYWKIFSSQDGGPVLPDPLAWNKEDLRQYATWLLETNPYTNAKYGCPVGEEN